MAKELNKEGLIKGFGILLLGIVLLSLVYNMFFQAGPTMMGGYYGGNMNGMHGEMGGYYGGVSGFSLTGLLAGLLLIFIKLLSILLVVALVVGIFMMLKKYLLEEGDLTWLWGSTQTVSCTNCGKNIKGNWDFCPSCGKELKKPVAAQ